MPAPLHPPPYRTDAASLDADTRMEHYTAGGAGGQPRNKTQNGVRLHPDPSGLIVSATERRSLEANRQAAFERLAERLGRLYEVKKPRRPTRPSRGAVKRRLADKAQKSKVKAVRRKTSDDD